jgi:3-methyladenine DNA glycosylase AlkD
MYVQYSQVKRVSLKLTAQGAHRFLNLFDTIKKELRLLTAQIQRINDYDYLYGDSEMLQNLFCRAFTNIIRFWCRVDKECDTCCEYSPFSIRENDADMHGI